MLTTDKIMAPTIAGHIPIISNPLTTVAVSFSIKPFPVEARKGFGGGDGYGSGFLYGLYQGWEVIDCLEFGSAEASMMVRSNNSSP